MKTLPGISTRLHLLLVVLLITFSGCNGQTSDYQKAKEAEKSIKDAPRPGTVPTTEGGWTMTAKVNGKEWTASAIVPPGSYGGIVGYSGKDSYIGVPGFQKRFAKVGKKNTIGESYSADIWIDGDPSYSNYTGTVEITKIDGDWEEGTFSFSTSTPKTMTVTDGFFRVKLK